MQLIPVFLSPFEIAGVSAKKTSSGPYSHLESPFTRSTYSTIFCSGRIGNGVLFQNTTP